MSRPNQSQPDRVTAEIYAQLGYPNPLVLQQALQTSTDREGATSTQYNKAVALDRLVSASGRILKGVHFDEEIPKIEDLIAFRLTKKHVSEYKEFVKLAGLNTIDLANTIRDNGSARNYFLSASDFAVSTSTYSLTSTTLNLDTSSFNLTAKQNITQASYNHLIADIDQHSTRYSWHRAERHAQYIADTESRLVLNNAENFYANLRECAGDRYEYADHYKIQVGKKPPSNCASGFAILNAALGLPEFAVPGGGLLNGLLSTFTGSVTSAASLVGTLGGVANLAAGIGAAGSIGGLVSMVAGLGGTEFIQSTLDQVGGLDAFGSAVQALSGGDAVNALFNQASSLTDLKGFVSKVPGAGPIMGLLDSSNTLKEAQDKLKAVQGVLDMSNDAKGDLLSENTKLTGPYGVYELVAEKEVNIRSCQIILKVANGNTDGSSVKIGANDATVTANSAKVVGRLEGMVYGNLRASLVSPLQAEMLSLKRIRINAPIVMINSGRPTIPPIPISQVSETTGSNSSEAAVSKPPEELPPALKAYSAVKSTQTQPAGASVYSKVEYNEPIAGTSGPQAGVRPGLQTDVNATDNPYAAFTPNSRPDVEPTDSPLNQ